MDNLYLGQNRIQSSVISSLAMKINDTGTHVLSDLSKGHYEYKIIFPQIVPVRDVEPLPERICDKINVK